MTMFTNGDLDRPLRVALYARVSTEDQAERETIQNQIQVAEALCPAMNLKIVDKYLDDGVSGTIPLEKRPEGARLLLEAEGDKFQQVVTYRLDRLGRKALVILSAWDSLKEIGISLRSLTEPFDTSQPFGEFVMGILAMVASYERDSIISRTSEGRRRKAREGYWTGGSTPLGYTTSEGMLEIDEYEAAIIRRIFQLYTEERMSSWKIAKLLNAEQVPTHSGLRGKASKDSRIISPNHWDNSRVGKIIQNETYAGTRHFGKKGNKGIILQSVPPVVSRDTWEKAQALRAANKTNSLRNAKRLYLLRGLLTCGQCGHRYVGRTQHKRPYYACSKQGCHNRWLRAETFEKMVWDDILKFIENPGEVIEQLHQQSSRIYDQDTQTELQSVDDTLTGLYEERQKILYAMRKSLISDEEAEAQLIATGQEKESLLLRKATLEAKQSEYAENLASLSTAESLLLSLQDKAEQATDDTKRQIIEALVSGATVHPEPVQGEISLQIAYRFDESGAIVSGTSRRGTGRRRIHHDAERTANPRRRRPRSGTVCSVCRGQDAVPRQVYRAYDCDSRP